LALSNKKLFRKLKKMRAISKQEVLTFTLAEYRTVAEKERLSISHLEDMNELLSKENFFIYHATEGQIVFGHDKHFRPPELVNFTDPLDDELVSIQSGL